MLETSSEELGTATSCQLHRDVAGYTLALQNRVPDTKEITIHW